MKTLNPFIRIGFFILIMFLIQSLSAQNLLSGRLMDEQGEPLPFATVLLLNTTDSSLVVGTITDTEGNFELSVSSQTYLLETTSVGYQTNAQLIQGAGNIGAITMREDTHQLDEVVVTAQKPYFEKQADRMVVNVQSKVTSAGSTALQVLERSPGIAVNRQSGRITMNGKSGVLVMIDGKMTRLPIDAVLQMLDGMSAANIEKIELITTPPSSMDAEGDAGVINIVTLETADLGTNGNYGVTFGRNQGPTYGGNFSLNHRQDKLNYFINYSTLTDDNTALWENYREIEGADFTQTNNSVNHRDPITTTQNLSAGIEFEMSPKTTGKVLVTGFHRNWDTNDLITNTEVNDPSSEIVTNISLREQNIWQSLGSSVGISHRFNERQTLSADFDYLAYDNRNPSQYDTNTLSQGESTESNIDVEKKTPIEFKIGKVDYVHQISDKLRIETGAKMTFSTFENDVTVQFFEAGQWNTIDRFSNASMLEESIQAGYVSFNWSGGQWGANGGVRYEYTDTYLTSEGNSVVDREYGNLFPTGFVSRKLGENSQAQLAYNRRITRPSFKDMAPWVFFAGPSTFFSGNSALRPAITDGLDLSYTFKQWWVSFKYGHTKNAIGFMQPEIDPDTNEQVMRAQNLKYIESWSVSTGLPVGITPWWEVQSDVSLYYQTYETKHLANDLKNSIWNMMFNTTSSISLPADYSLEISANYQTKMLWGAWEFKPLGQVNVGLRKKFQNDGVLTLNATDILHTQVWKAKSILPDANAFATTQYDLMARGINLTYSKTFGNRKLRSVNIQSASAEERSRVN